MFPVHPSKDDFMPTQFKTNVQSQLSCDSFVLSEEEVESLTQVHNDMILYMCERFVSVESDQSSLPIVPGFKCKLLLDSDNVETEISKFSYMYVLDEPADSRQTLLRSLHLLYDSFKVSKDINHLVVAGDGATFKLILDIKQEYGDSMEWLIPYIGDWHLLKNYQEVIMKIFWDSGLKDLAKSTHKNMTLNSLCTCSNFKRTHRFLLQAHEAILMLQFQCFLDQRNITDDSEALSNTFFLDSVKSLIQSLVIKDGNIDASTFKDLQSEFSQSPMFTSMKEEFLVFRKEMSDKLETFRFWDRFVHEDCMAYIHLFIAIRSRNWHLRNAAVKEMAPLFQACDRQNYSKMIPLHIGFMQALPDYILKHFENGAFASNIKGTELSSLGLDEAHEMTINKDIKMSWSRSLPKNMDRIAGTIQYQAKLISNIQDELDVFTPKKIVLHRDLSPSVIKAEFANVKMYFGKLLTTQMFLPNQEPQLYHVFTNVPATKDQQASLLSYRQIGQDSYLLFCKFQILKDSSNKKPVTRRHKLKTFAKSKVTRRRMTNLEKEKKMITLCYKRTIAFSEDKGLPISTLCQFVEKPRAICNSNDLPHKGAKWVMYDIFNKRYGEKFNIITCNPKITLPGACYIAEGMNIIYTSPLRTVQDVFRLCNIFSPSLDTF